jgi:hypothetical protein
MNAYRPLPQDFFAKHLTGGGKSPIRFALDIPQGRKLTAGRQTSPLLRRGVKKKFSMQGERVYG